MISLPAQDRLSGDPRRGLVQASCRHVCKCCGACQPLLVIFAVAVFSPTGKIHQIQLLALNGKYWQVVFKKTGKGELFLMTFHRLSDRGVKRRVR